MFLFTGAPPGEVHADIGLPTVNPSGSSLVPNDFVQDFQVWSDGLP
jgi:hypothetical protein